MVKDKKKEETEASSEVAQPESKEPVKQKVPEAVPREAKSDAQTYESYVGDVVKIVQKLYPNAKLDANDSLLDCLQYLRAIEKLGVKPQARNASEPRPKGDALPDKVKVQFIPNKRRELYR